MPQQVAPVDVPDARRGRQSWADIDKIRSSWLSERWQVPTPRESQRPDRVEFDLPMISTPPETVLTALRTRFGDSFDALTSDEIEARDPVPAAGSRSCRRSQPGSHGHNAGNA